LFFLDPFGFFHLLDRVVAEPPFARLERISHEQADENRGECVEQK
jgi:hypothetical protein